MIGELLFAHQDLAYREFQRKLIPGLDPNTIIGVRTPELRAIAGQIPDPQAFLRTLPHSWFEENLIHGFLISAVKDFGEAVRLVDAYLPYVDNWAACDQLNVRCFRNHQKEMLPYISRWLGAEHCYTVRFGIKMLMDHFLDGHFDSQYPTLVASLRREEYYIKMMAAWYFATALAKRFDAVLPWIAEYRLEKWTHNKAIQKAVESCRITPEQKGLLKQYRIR